MPHVVTLLVTTKQDIKVKGWNAPEGKPYAQLGDFADVLTALEGVKSNIPHVKQGVDYYTYSNIKALRRLDNQQPSKRCDPGRTLKILD